MAAFEDRPVHYDPAEITRAGIFVSIGGEGALHIERGFVRVEDEAPVEPIEGSDREAPEAAGPSSPTAARRRALRRTHWRRTKPSGRFRIGW
jgi:ParB family chromosome partitioning protein